MKKKDVAAQPVEDEEDVKQFLSRQMEYPENCAWFFEPYVWEALHNSGFEKIRLEFTECHNTWAFRMRSEIAYESHAKAVEKRIRAAMKTLGVLVPSDAVAVRVEGKRLIGAFIAKPFRCW